MHPNYLIQEQHSAIGRFAKDNKQRGGFSFVPSRRLFFSSFIFRFVPFSPFI
jgi:hypothetical protein